MTSSRSQETSIATDVDMESVGTPSGHSGVGSNDSTEDEEGTEPDPSSAEVESSDEEMGEDEQEETGRGRDWWLVDTVNANAWGGGEAEGTKGRGALDFLQRTAADVVMVQETRLVGAMKREAAHRAARKAKWNLLAPEAATTAKGNTSAGVALATRVGFGMAGGEAMESGEHDRTRVEGRHVGILCRGGVHIFSVYLHTAQGLSDPNKELLKQLARLVKMTRGPWIIGGDWNLPPEALAEAGWVDEVEGKIIATKAPTCGAARLDYFVIDRRLGPAVAYIKKLTGFGISPHHPVRLALRAEARSLLVRAMVAPRKIPAYLPQGCLTEQQCAGSVLEVPGEPGPNWVAPTLTLRIQRWFDCAEQVWVDILGKEGEERQKMTGRARGPKFVWKCALGPPADPALLSTKAARSWKNIEVWRSAIRLAHTHPKS